LGYSITISHPIGWFLFETELWTPMIIVMLLYTGLYSIFGILSVFYYKKVIKEAL